MTWPNPPSWLLLNAAALIFALAHTLVDAHIGLFGETSTIMTPSQAARILLECLVFGWWSISLALAVSHGGAGLSGAFVLSFVRAFLFDGAVAVVVGPPPSAAFPYQDITHFGSLLFGGLASYAIWKEMRDRAIPFNRQFVLITIALIVIALAVSSILALSNLASMPPVS